MKRSQQDRLLRDLLADEALDELRTTALDQMLVTARRRRQRRALLSTAAALGVIVAAAFLASRRMSSTIQPRPAAVAAPAAALSSPRVATISDEQLLAIFADRAVALVGRPGEQTLLFLDTPPRVASRSSLR